MCNSLVLEVQHTFLDLDEQSLGVDKLEVWTGVYPARRLAPEIGKHFVSLVVGRSLVTDWNEVTEPCPKEDNHFTHLHTYTVTVDSHSIVLYFLIYIQSSGFSVALLV